MTNIEKLFDTFEDENGLEIRKIKKDLETLEQQYQELLPRKGMSENDDKQIEDLENQITNLKGDLERLENNKNTNS